MDKKMFNESALISWKDVDSSGWQNIVGEIIRMFFEVAPVQYSFLKSSISSQSLSGVRIAAHTLKSSCGNVGAELAHSILDQIEKEADASETKNLEKLLFELDPIFNQSQAELKIFLDKLYEA
jgi:two-component system sensor histidine kinase/response regulator